MKRVVIGLIWLTVWTGGVSAQMYWGNVNHVIDGDTIQVTLRDGTRQTVRLWGVDAPEFDQPYGRQARMAVREIVSGEWVIVDPKGEDRWGRVIAEVFIDPQAQASLQEALVREGVVWWYRRFAPEMAEWGFLQEDARRARQGLWSLSPDPLPPWEWRRIN